MKTNLLKPRNPVIGGIIESYLFVETAEVTEYTTVPNGRVDASIILGGELERYSGTHGYFESLPPALFYPLTTTIGRYRSRKHLNCIGIKFYPHVLSFSAFDNKLSREPFNFDEVFNASENKQLILNLRRWDDHDEMVSILDLFFHDRLFANSLPNSWIMDVTREIESGTPEQVRIVKMAEAMGMNVKTFERRFQKTIGLTPKSFAAIIRLHQAIRNIQKNGPTISHGDLIDALNSGYYDQSHFIKSCLRITGLTPKKILTGLPEQITDLILGKFCEIPGENGLI